MTRETKPAPREEEDEEEAVVRLDLFRHSRPYTARANDGLSESRAPLSPTLSLSLSRSQLPENFLRLAQRTHGEFRARLQLRNLVFCAGAPPLRDVYSTENAVLE